MADGQSILLSALPPSRAQVRLAASMACVLLLVLVVTLPFMQVQLPPVQSFIPVVDTLLFINDLITAALLFAHFSVTRSRALLALACGYLFAALVIVPHGLTFPGAFAPDGLLGANLQSTVWLYIFWHLGLPPAAIAYALLKDRAGDALARLPVRQIIVGSVLGVACAVAVLTWLVTGGATVLPSIMVDALHASADWHTYWAPALIALSVTSMALVWRHRSSVLDLWLLVVLWAWFIETVLLSTTAYRYSLVWYAGRAFGLMSSCFVLLVLLSEATLLYARLVVSVAAHNREREARMMTMDALSASMAHDINQPLGAIVANSESGLALLERTPKDLDELRAVLTDIRHDGERAGEVVASIRSIFREGRELKGRVAVDEIIRDVVAILRGELDAHGIAVRLDLAADGAAIRGNRGQVQHVVLNLATNAIDAMAELSGRPRVLAIASRIEGGGGVQVSVTDTGHGVAPAIAERIFEAFFTTRADGTGMGLAICRSLVASHGGRVWLARDHAEGAAFVFSLPADQYTESARSAPQPSPRLAQDLG